MGAEREFRVSGLGRVLVSVAGVCVAAGDAVGFFPRQGGGDPVC
jgi:hypothetical protein